MGIGLNRLAKIVINNQSKIVLIVLDGLGGIPHPDTGKTELETAIKPNLDSLAKNGICGLINPVSAGITPGSAPGHLSLFGYDPLEYFVGRGVLEALGIDFDLKDGDVAARGNFCTIDEKGLITDRRAGRIATELNQELCQLLSGIIVPGAKLFVCPVKEHRFVVVFRGDGLSADIEDTDPQQTGKPPKDVAPVSGEARATASLVKEFIKKATVILRDKKPANMVLLRGFSNYPRLPDMRQVFKLNPLAIAAYPMYRGLARLVGMKLVKSSGNIESEFGELRRNFKEYDYFFVHIKGTDAAGEDGDFQRKVRVIETVDKYIGDVSELSPDVIMVTGDHSTPALLKGHSWHPVPFLLSSKYCRSDDVTEFSERACLRGGLGIFPAVEVMPLALANALKLTKYGA